MLKTDILIVGAGPAGTYLAEKLASKGIDTTIIEKKKEIGKHACSGLVSTRINDFVKIDNSLIENKIKGSTFHSKNTSFTIKRQDTQAYVLNRPAFDRFMADRAKSSGAKLLTGISFESYHTKDGRVYTKTDKETIQSKIIVGCDGAGSVVRKASGLNTGKKQQVSGILGYTDEKNNSDLVELFYGKDIAPGFFAWKIPRGERTEYGLASDRDHIGHFNRFIAEHNIKIDKTYTHPICFGIIDKTAADNILLLGDAALQVKPFSGGGIIYSFLCADIASEVIVKAVEDNNFTSSALNDYDRQWKSRLAEKIELGLGIRKTLNSLSDTELVTFFSILSKSRKDIERFGDMDFL
ncbi:geranylgeranyl reductase family protein [archaeon]|nr:geranylgeranyl reductase family protein [archaeon]